MTEDPSILHEGRNCWRILPASRAAFLVDGEAYFRAFAEVAEQARHALYIVGWDIDSRIELRRDGRERELPERLGPFLDALAARRPELQVYILDWDFAMLYALEREPLPIFKLGWRTHERVHFQMDDEHPVGASHHQKIVVADDQVAFVGGFDLTKARWDTREHLAEDRRRQDNGSPYAPFHDVQLLVEGDAARALGELSRERWHRATGQTLEPPPRDGEPPWPSCEPDLEELRVAIARTDPQHNGRSQVDEVKQLYLDLIGAARQTLYVENQYFTSAAIGEALAANLALEEGPEVVLVLPRECSGWLEETTMGVLRARLLRRLRQADRGGRLRIYFPDREGLDEVRLQVHAKVMIVDDQVVRIGSSNLSNRSMGMDTECDLAVAAGEDPAVRQGIRDFRDGLVAEHLGVEPQRLRQAVEREGTLGLAIESLRGGNRTLRPLEEKVEEWLEELVPDADILDPEQPIGLEELVADMAPEEKEPKSRDWSRFKGWLLGGVLLAALALAGAWRWTPLQEWLDLDRLAGWAEAIRASGMAPLLAVGAFVVGGMVLLPVTLMILATAITFGPVSGFIYAMLGSLCSAVLSYWIGRGLGRDTVRRLVGERLNRLSRYLVRQGLLVATVIRMIPLAPFTVVNVVAGTTHIRFRDYFFGTLIGMTPGTLAIILFEGSLEHALRNPRPQSFLILGGVIAMLAAGGWGLKRWLSRKQRMLKEETSPRDKRHVRSS